MTIGSCTRSFIRRAVAATICPPGAVRTILAGPSRGLRYRVFPEFGLSPLRGGWEADLQRSMVELVRPGSVVYDVGANYGIHTLLLARLTGGAGHVYAFEPAPEICFDLQRNIDLNGFTNVTALQLAVAAETSRKKFVRGTSDATGSLAKTRNVSGAAVDVEAVSLDDFVFERANRPPNVVKIDVEGGEDDVIIGASRLLRSVRPVLMVELHSPAQDLAVGAALSTNRYSAYRIQKGSAIPVTDFAKPWPAPNGIWGQIIALPSA